MARILVVDDESKVRTILKLMLASAGHEIVEASNGYDALSKLEEDSFDLVITDIKMEGLDGVALLGEIKDRGIACPVVFITAFATLESAIEALRLGAADYLVKPFDEKQVRLAVERALGFGKIMSENIRLKRVLTKEEENLGVFVSKVMQEVRDAALRVAPTMSTVLITGESGVGKEVIARLIHRKSLMKSGNFVAINCAAIPGNLVESELFGHEKGAFTGADRKKDGHFQMADGGTLFLDEVGDLPLEAQAKLLRAIQEKSIKRVGGTRPIPVNIRLICATNQNLEELVAEGKFRQDLFYRIAVFPINVPPLRERKEAIVPLAEHFIRKFVKAQDLNRDLLTPGACKLLKEYTWPGNVRELANAIERAIISKGGNIPITSDDLSFLKRSISRKSEMLSTFKLPPGGIKFDMLQRSIVEQAMEMTGGNQSAAARLLGLSRARFRTLLRLISDGK